MYFEILINKLKDNISLVIDSIILSTSFIGRLSYNHAESGVYSYVSDGVYPF